jgi:hypothetical protein
MFFVAFAQVQEQAFLASAGGLAKARVSNFVSNPFWVEILHQIVYHSLAHFYQGLATAPSPSRLV